MRVLIFTVAVLIGLAIIAPGVPAAPSDCRFLTGSNGGVAFCDSFDSPSDGSTRAGELNGVIWGASRGTGNNNFSGLYNAWEPTVVEHCPGPNPALSTDDIRVCNGQLVEGSTDAHVVTTLAMYPKQPMDIAGRTGTVVFDVSNDTSGTHAAWPEFWFTDQPIPAPFQFTDSWSNSPRNGFGISFAGGCGPDGLTWGVDHIVINTNYVASLIGVQSQNCVTKGSRTAMNHVEIKFSTTQLDVWASDAGSSTMKHILSYPWAISLTRGLIWIEDVHYNGDKACDGKPIPPCALQHEHTFVWDNVGFDGPFTYRDLSYDVLDNQAPASYPQCPTCRSLGWIAVNVNETPTLQTLPIPAGVSGQAARLMFTYFQYEPVASFTFAVNGHQHTSPVPAPFMDKWFTGRTLAIDIPLSDLVVGPQTIKLWGDRTFIFANVNIVLVDTGGAPSTPTPTLTPLPPTPTPTTTSSPIPPTSTVTVSPSTSTPTPSSTVAPSPTATPSTVPTSTPVPVTPTPAPNVLCYRSTDGGNTIIKVAC